MQIRGFGDLCPPAHVYLVLSTIAVTVIFLQNYYSGSFNNRTYCLGLYSCEIPSLSLLFFIKILYILFWTWVLNFICEMGAPQISWVLVLLPFILFFIILASIMFSNGNKIV
jgi:hypothetical protein